MKHKTRAWSFRLSAYLVLAPVLILTVLVAGIEVGRAESPSDDTRWTTFTTQDGLAGNRVRAIWGDERAVWFGTDRGLSRYDGLTWQNFNTTDGLVGDEVRAIWGDNKGTLWVGTAIGLSSYDGQRWRTFNRQDGLPSDNVRSIWGDADGHVWVATEPDRSPVPAAAPGSGRDTTGGVGLYDGSTWRSVLEPAPFERSLIFYEEGSINPLSTRWSSDGGRFAAARAVSGDGQGNVWLGHGRAEGDGKLLSGGVSQRDGSGWQRFTTENSALPDDTVNALWAEPGGRLWVGTGAKGVSYFDGHAWQNFGERAAGKTVLALWGDGRGGIWVGTRGMGASFYDGRRWRRFTTRDGLADDTVLAVWGDGRGRVWLGTTRGASLYNTGQWNAFQVRTGLPSSDVQAVWGDGAGGVWIGTRDGGVARYKAGQWQTFTQLDGLPGNWVTDIDGTGPEDIWVALGGDGAAHFDGYRWQAMPREDALGWDWVHRLWRSNDGVTYFATLGGLKGFDGANWRTVGTKDGLKVSTVVRVLGDQIGRLWVAYSYPVGTPAAAPGSTGPSVAPPPSGAQPFPGGVGHYDGRGWTYYEQADGLGTNDVRAIWADERGQVWAGGLGALARFDGARWRIVDEGVGGATAIWGDGRGTLWFGSQQQAGQRSEAVATRFDGATWRQFTTTKDGLSSGEVTDIWGDAQGRVWLAHGGTGGVSVYDNGRWQVWHVENGPPSPAVRALAKDGAGRLWLGTGDGVSVFDGARWRNFGAKDGLASLDVADLWVGEGGDVWVAHGSSGANPGQVGVSRFDGTRWINYSPVQGLGGADVGAIWGDDRGAIWAGGRLSPSDKGKGWVARFDGTRWQTFPVDGGSVEAIWGDDHGSVWFRMAQGVGQFDGRVWRHYPSLRAAVEANYAGLRERPHWNRLWAVDLAGRVWIAEGDGAASYDGRDWQRYNEATGLAGDKVNAIVLDRGGTLWLATDNGLSRTDGRLWRTFRVANSGLGNDVVRAIREDERGNLVFTTDLWYTTYTPSPPQPRIERLISLADGQVFTPTTGLALDHGQRSLRIEFSAVAPWTATGGVMYRYRLVGVDQAWRYLDASRSEARDGVQYLELAPGSYTFAVSAGNRNLDYSAPVNVTFTVRSAPPTVGALSATVDGGPPLALREDYLYLDPTLLPGTREVVFPIDASDDGATPPSLSYRLDRLDSTEERGATQPVAGPALKLAVEPGHYRLTLLAADAEGNQSTVTKYISAPPSQLIARLPFVLLAVALALAASGYFAWRWARTPTGRAYLAYRRIRRAPSSLLPQASALLEESGPAALTVLARVAQPRNADITRVASALDALTRPETAADGLARLLGYLGSPKASTPDGVARCYEVLLEAMRARTVADIAAEGPVLEQLLRVQEQSLERSTAMAVRRLQRAANLLLGAQAVPMERQEQFLYDALHALDGKAPGEDMALEAELPLPFRLAFRHAVALWCRVIDDYVEKLRSRARLLARLLTHSVVPANPVGLALELRNEGQGLARGVSVTLPPSDGPSAAGQGLASLPLLLPGQRAVLEVSVPLPPEPRGATFPVTLTIGYDDREAWGKQEMLKDEVRWHDPTHWVPFGNPYVVGRPPERDSLVFVGREDVFAFVRSALLQGQRQNVLALIGQRRMGKSSILAQLPGRMGDRVVCVRLDCAGLGVGADTAGLLYEVASTIGAALSAAGAECPAVSPGDFQVSPGLVFERDILRPALDSIGDRRMLWMLDELEAWATRAQQGRFDREVIGFLRHLVERYDSLALLIAGSQRLFQVPASGISPLLNLAATRHLDVLDEKAARALIEEPLRGALFWDELAISRLSRLTAGHPYFLQAACWVLADQCNAEQRSFVGPQDVEATVVEICELADAHLQELWREGTDFERLMLATLARLGREGSVVAAAEVVSYLTSKHAYRPETGQVVRTLEALAERQVLRRVADGQYAFLVPLFGRWVRETWSTESFL